MKIDPTLLTILGSIITIGLGINAFFFKQMATNLFNVDKGLTVLITKHERTEKDVENNAETTKEQGKEISRMRDNIHDMKSDVTNLALNLQLSCSKLQDKELIKPKRIKNHG